jgi:hypothetical protein
MPTPVFVQGRYAPDLHGGAVNRDWLGLEWQRNAGSRFDQESISTGHEKVFFQLDSKFRLSKCLECSCVRDTQHSLRTDLTPLHELVGASRNNAP